MSGPDKQRNALLQAQAWLERQVGIASGQADDIPDEDYADMFNAVLALIDDALQEPSGWQPIETCPKHIDVLFYREDAGVFFGQYTYCAEWVSEEEQLREQYSEETLWSEDAWAFDWSGASRCEGDVKPTHWMPLPTAPSTEVAG